MNAGYDIAAEKIRQANHEHDLVIWAREERDHGGRSTRKQHAEISHKK